MTIDTADWTWSVSCGGRQRHMASESYGKTQSDPIFDLGCRVAGLQNRVAHHLHQRLSAAAIRMYRRDNRPSRRPATRRRRRSRMRWSSSAPPPRPTSPASASPSTEGGRRPASGWRPLNGTPDPAAARVLLSVVLPVLAPMSATDDLNNWLIGEGRLLSVGAAPPPSPPQCRRARCRTTDRRA